ncbi:hypothetical protein N7G274_009225 [Stereocaulon virgatum]|uniref:Mitochondrial intermembrane space import and assembly protein 40 n=1 Tax=Stereocaulon virgatum TaxID=373712 RepID=A0ABR3ZXT9_9LECA
MIRQAPHLLRPSSKCLRAFPTRRFLSTAPPAQKSRSWKSSAVRWGLAIGAVYYYNTSNLFAEEPPFAIPTQSTTEETSLPTLESIASSRRQKAAPKAPLDSPPPSDPTTSPATLTPTATEGLEEEASQEGAFNEETGEINWDCPCLGGMAHGPCGEQFRAAFSCFVYSKEEPKGMECIPHFKNMQDCFREHPDVYGGELEEDEEGVEGEEAPAGLAGENGGLPAAATNATDGGKPAPATAMTSEKGGEEVKDATQRAKRATEQVRSEHSNTPSESEELVPKAAFDATDAKVVK